MKWSSGQFLSILLSCNALAISSANAEDLRQILSETKACKGCDMQGADLSSMDLRSVDLSESNLSGANFSGADLRRVDFKGANLTKTDFSKAEIDEANFSNADLGGANMDNAEIEESDFSGAVLDGVSFGNTEIEESDFSGASLLDINTLNVDFDSKSVFDDTRFSFDDLSDAGTKSIQSAENILQTMEQTELQLSAVRERAGYSGGRGADGRGPGGRWVVNPFLRVLGVENDWRERLLAERDKVGDPEKMQVGQIYYTAYDVANSINPNYSSSSVGTQKDYSELAAVVENMVFSDRSKAWLDFLSTGSPDRDEINSFTNTVLDQLEAASGIGSCIEQQPTVAEEQVYRIARRKGDLDKYGHHFKVETALTLNQMKRIESQYQQYAACISSAKSTYDGLLDNEKQAIFELALTANIVVWSGREKDAVAKADAIARDKMEKDLSRIPETREETANTEPVSPPLDETVQSVEAGELDEVNCRYFADNVHQIAYYRMFGESQSSIVAKTDPTVIGPWWYAVHIKWIDRIYNPKPGDTADSLKAEAYETCVAGRL